MSTQKLISFTVPCYNSQDYMDHCIESLLAGGEDVEILIVDDGSRDATGSKADAWQKKYPDIIRAIHQENKGHGGVINTGIANAEGIWFKAVDSDDWLNEEPYLQLLSLLKRFVQDRTLVDLVISNFIYQKKGKKNPKVMNLTGSLPADQIFTWEQFHLKRPDRYLLMHSLLYRTQLLKDSGIVLPEHVFYEDNIFAYQPLPYVKTMYYLDVNLYSYFIGRADQSVQESIMIKRLDQQMKINKIMIDAWKLSEDPMVQQENLHKYMVNDLTIITTISSILCVRAHSDEALEKKNALWAYLKEKDPVTYEQIRHGMIGKAISTENKKALHADEVIYSMVQKVFGFN